MSTDEERREDARIEALEAKREAMGTARLRPCPDCGKMKRADGFQRGPYGYCCAGCYAGYLPE